MLAIEVELLGGRYVATEHNDRSRAEWPPHPARFFSALVAALHDNAPVDAQERAALLWLEAQEAPALDVDLEEDENIGRREVRPIFVPVNDITLVGDPEAPLREARERLQALAPEGQAGKPTAEQKKAASEVAKLEKRFKKAIADQQLVGESPSASDIDKATWLLPERRVRQERTFPVVVPSRSTFAFVWPQAEPREHTEALGRLCERVTRLGHSSSLVRCSLIDRVFEPTLVPNRSGDIVLRVVAPGQLERLEAAFERHQARDPRVLPARPQRYGRPGVKTPEPPRSVFGDDWIVFERIRGHRPLASRGGDLAIGLRKALIEIHGSEDLPQVIVGRNALGERSSEPHLAFVPLPWVGHEHADGSVQAIALVIPRSMGIGERQIIHRLIAKLERERGDETDDYAIDLGTPSGLGRPIRVMVRRVEVPTKATSSTRRWCRASRRFVTATPIALDRHPGNLRSNVEHASRNAAASAEAAIADACVNIGLPRPVSVEISLAPLLPGAQHVRQYAPWPPHPGRTRRARVHADVRFAEAVAGPLLLGAGRYFGLGLCLPVATETHR